MIHIGSDFYLTHLKPPAKKCQTSLAFTYKLPDPMQPRAIEACDF